MHFPQKHFQASAIVQRLRILLPIVSVGNIARRKEESEALLNTIAHVAMLSTHVNMCKYEHIGPNLICWELRQTLEILCVFIFRGYKDVSA